MPTEGGIIVELKTSVSCRGDSNYLRVLAYAMTVALRRRCEETETLKTFFVSPAANLAKAFSKWKTATGKKKGNQTCFQVLQIL